MSPCFNLTEIASRWRNGLASSLSSSDCEGWRTRPLHTCFEGHGWANDQKWSSLEDTTMAKQSQHISSSFDAALYGLKNDVLMMSSLTDRMFQTAVEGLLHRDSDLCSQVAADDDEIDLLEKKVDRDGVNLLVRFQPVASDMREVISAMKVSTSLERIGDESVTIARRAKRLNPRLAMSEVSLLEPLFHLALVIFRDSIRAFADGDCEHARTLKLKDRELDALTDNVIDRLSERVTHD